MELFSANITKGEYNKMNREVLTDGLFYGNYPYDFLNLLHELNLMKKENKRKFEAMTPGEQQEYLRKEQEEKERIKQAEQAVIHNKYINRGYCPGCKSKLVRGKKDKKKGYKRSWYCNSCDKNYTREDV